MEVKIIEEQQNILLKRKEIQFEVEHSQTKGTPSRLEIRNKLAEMLKTKPEFVYIKRVETKTGTMKATGQANAYESLEQAKFIEPKYIVTRNMPPAEKKEKPEEKVEAPPKKAEKPEKKEKPAKTEQPAEEIKKEQ